MGQPAHSGGARSHSHRMCLTSSADFFELAQGVQEGPGRAAGGRGPRFPWASRRAGPPAPPPKGSFNRGEEARQMQVRYPLAASAADCKTLCPEENLTAGAVRAC